MLAVLGRRRAGAEEERERAEAVPEPERATG
jgi:hypothetical protein